MPRRSKSYAKDRKTIKLVQELTDEVPVKAKLNKRQRELETAHQDGYRAGFQSASNASRDLVQDEINRNNQQAASTDVAINSLFLRFSRSIFKLGV